MCLTFLMLLEIRAVIHFLWLKNLPNPEISHKIDSIYGAGVTGSRTIQKWTHRFEEGEHSLEDEPRPSHPCSTEHVDAIYALLAYNPYLLQKRIGYTLGIHQSIVKYILSKDLSLRKINFKWIPHLLDDNQKLERVRLLTELLEFFESKLERPLANRHIGDEM